MLPRSHFCKNNRDNSPRKVERKLHRAEYTFGSQQSVGNIVYAMHSNSTTTSPKSETQRRKLYLYSTRNKKNASKVHSTLYEVNKLFNAI